jgi:uncharacterized membrane protein YdjX (TVP38/TMEM64 family)
MDQDKSTPVSLDRRRTIIWITGLLMASMGIGFVWDTAFGHLIPIRPSAIEAWLGGLGNWAPFAYIAGMTIAVVISPIPSVPLDIASGLTFGLVRGTVYTLIGAEIGAIICFQISRLLGRPWLARRLPEATMRRIDTIADRQGVKALVIMRLLPIFNFDWVSYAAGLTTISLARFAGATLVGMTPPVIAITAVGSTFTDKPIVAGALFGALIALTLGPVAVWYGTFGRNRNLTK